MADRLDEILEQLLGRPRRRRDALDDRLVLPHDPDPWLVQRAETFMVLALAVELLASVERRGGAAVRHSRIEAVRAKLRARIGRGQRRHLDEELVAIWTWIEEACAGRDLERNEPLDDERDATLRFDPEPRRLLAREAIDSAQDLYLEHLDAEGRAHRVRVRPDEIVERPADDEPDTSRLVLLAAAVPSGAPVELPLTAIRWLMAVKRFGELQSREPLAPVLQFPSRPGSPGDDT